MGFYGFEPQTPPTCRSALNQLPIFLYQLLNVFSAFLRFDAVLLSTCFRLGRILFRIDQRPWNTSFSILASSRVMSKQPVFEIDCGTNVISINTLRVLYICHSNKKEPFNRLSCGRLRIRTAVPLLVGQML